MKRLVRLAAAGILGAAALSAFAVPRGTKEQARAMLDQAVACIQKEGAQKAFRTFNDRKGPFVKGDLYVFVIDLDGTYQATGLRPDALVGLNVRDTRDAYGKPLFQDMIALAKTQGEGVVDYVWLNRATNTMDPKTSYIKRVGDYVVGVGYYTPRAYEEGARRLLERAALRLKEQGPASAFAAFNDRNGEFVRGDLYVFVFDLDGKYMASGAAPQLAGTAAGDMTDAMGKPVVKNIIEAATAGGEGAVDYVWRNPVTNKVENKRSLVKKMGDYVVGVGYYPK